VSDITAGVLEVPAHPKNHFDDLYINGNINGIITIKLAQQNFHHKVAILDFSLPRMVKTFPINVKLEQKAGLKSGLL
jgi:hypothetical protein